MYYKILYEYRGRELFNRFNNADELIDFLNELRKSGKVDAGTIWISTVL